MALDCLYLASYCLGIIEMILPGTKTGINAVRNGACNGFSLAGEVRVNLSLFRTTNT